MKDYIIKVHATNETRAFTGRFFGAMAAAKKISLEFNSWVTLASLDDMRSVDLAHKTIANRK